MTAALIEIERDVAMTNSSGTKGGSPDKQSPFKVLKTTDMA